MKVIHSRGALPDRGEVWSQLLPCLLLSNVFCSVVKCCRKIFWTENVLCCVCYTDEDSSEVLFVADSSDIIEHKKPRLKSVLCVKQFTRKRCTYTCGQCGKTFSSRGALFNHTNVHNGTYKCTECGKCCGSNHDLTAHRRTHSGEKPFECTVCGKRFATPSDLVVHGRIHSGEKPYKCHMCDRAFSQSASRNKHELVHTGDRPSYRCFMCDKTYNEARQLNLHLHSHMAEPFWHLSATWLLCALMMNWSIHWLYVRTIGF